MPKRSRNFASCAPTTNGKHSGIDPHTYSSSRTFNHTRLLRGRQLGIDSSVMEANASLRALEHRNTEENYWDYVKRLAAEAGIDPADTKAVRRFDQKREGRKTSHQDWQNPHDVEAKVGRTKDGACDMIDKPEHVSDLESGAILTAQVRPGDAADHDPSLCERVMEAVATLSEVAPEAPLEKLGRELCGDEGYFAIEQIAQLQECAVRTVISDPQAGRRNPHKVSEEHRAALRRAKRATLRGCEKLTKRHLVAASAHHLSLLLRPLFGIGTPKQALAGACEGLCLLITWLWRGILRQLDLITCSERHRRLFCPSFPAIR